MVSPVTRSGTRLTVPDVNSLHELLAVESQTQSKKLLVVVGGGFCIIPRQVVAIIVMLLLSKQGQLAWHFSTATHEMRA